MTHPNIVENESDLADIVRSIQVVAVLGMKDESEAHTPAFQIPQMMKEHGIKVIPVNPRIRQALGIKAFPTLADVGERFDTNQFFRRSSKATEHAQEILALPPESRPKYAWMQTGVRNELAALLLAEAGIKVVMDRCLGVYVSRYRTGGKRSS